MTHINIRPAERSRSYETAEQAINHIFVFGLHASDWDYDGQPFGRTLDDRRKIIAATQARDFAAFKASRRRGYWRIELRAPAVMRGPYAVQSRETDRWVTRAFAYSKGEALKDARYLALLHGHNQWRITLLGDVIWPLADPIGQIAELADLGRP